VRDNAAQVTGITSKERVEADYVPTFVQQPLAKMRADEARASGNYRSWQPNTF
jgi:hypothetical protein